LRGCKQRQKYHTRVVTPSPIPRINGSGEVEIATTKKKYAVKRRKARM